MESSAILKGKNSSEITQIKKVLSNLLNKPFKNETLSQKEFDFILDIIEIDPDMLNEIGFKPDKFYELIDKNVDEIENGDITSKKEVQIQKEKKKKKKKFI